MEQSCDTLGRWMIHHLAELIETAEQSSASERAEQYKECRTAILELWEHIYSLPPAMRPFRDLESVVGTIRALNPDEREYYYQTQAQELADNSALPDSSKEWLKLSRGIDHSARLLIRMCLDRVMAETSGKFREWMELATDAGARDLSIMRIVYELEDQGDRQRKAKDKLRKDLEDRRERLQGMVQLSQMLVADIERQIKEIDQS